MSKAFRIVALVVVIGVLGLLFFHAKAKSFVFEQLERSLGRPVQASGATVRWPLTVVIEGAKLGNNISADALIVKPSIWGMLIGKRVFNSFVAQRLLIRLVWTKDGKMDLGLPTVKEGTAPRAKAKPVFVDRLLIQDGVVEFVDEAVSSPEPFRLRMADIRLSAFRSSLVQPTKAKFSGEGRLADAGDKTCGSLGMSGWVDFLSKDMDAEVEIEGLSAMDFSPYFQRYLKMLPVAGEVAVHSDLKSVRNDLEVKTRVRINNLSLQSQQELSSAEPRDWGVMVLLGMLNAQGEITLNIAFNTKLDEPKFENMSIENASLKPPGKSVVPPMSAETVQGYKKIGQEFEAMGKEFKAMFTKESSVSPSTGSGQVSATLTDSTS